MSDETKKLLSLNKSSNKPRYVYLDKYIRKTYIITQSIDKLKKDIIDRKRENIRVLNITSNLKSKLLMMAILTFINTVFLIGIAWIVFL